MALALTRKAAALALKAASNNRERHRVVEDFFLANDCCTLAAEVPVWFWEKKLNPENGGTSICGHIDLLQTRYGKLHVLDFKPNAAKEKPWKVASQLYLYALGISFRARVPLASMRCAWFDDKNYFEFEPARVHVDWPESTALQFKEKNADRIASPCPKKQ